MHSLFLLMQLIVKIESNRNPGNVIDRRGCINIDSAGVLRPLLHYAVVPLAGGPSCLRFKRLVSVKSF
jgi:hypothetical protein